MALTLDSKRTAILPLDLQNDNIAGTAGLEEKQTLEKIARLLDAGRRKKVPIIHITASVRADYLDMPKSNALWRALRASKKLILGTPGAEIHPLVAPRPDELVINKTCVDPFLSTNLGQALINFDVNTLIVCGLWTNYVVEATTRHAADIGYHVVVVSDCCASNNEENHRFAMERILPTLATVATLDEVVAALA